MRGFFLQVIILINPAINYLVFRASGKRQIKAQLAAKTQSICFAHGAGPGYSIGKSRTKSRRTSDAELALS
jgi:hypothetical protein